MNECTSNGNSPTPKLRLDDETLRLWDALLNAKRDHKNLGLLAGDLDCLSGRFDRYVELVLPLSVELQSLLVRVKDLTDEWSEHLCEIDESLQGVAWQFASHAFGLHRGDCVRYGIRILSTDHLFVTDEAVGSLGLRGRILTKRGVPGRREVEFALLQKPWSIVEAASK